MTIDQGAMGAIARSILSDVIENDNNVLQKFNYRHKFSGASREVGALN